MITQDNFQSVLTALGFSVTGSVYQKSFADSAYSLAVDFDKKELIFPETLVIHSRQTCNFSQNENFVVFECVCRLLDKGYKPQHIELEPKWKLGHGAKSGRADILIYDQEKTALLIIECKTAGKEFEKAWKDTLDDGAQLFSYVEQEKATRFVCLYASGFDDKEKKITQEYYVVSVQDNPKVLENLPEQAKNKSFKEANNNKERFLVWKTTYQQEAMKRGIFEDNILAYQVGKDKYQLLIDTKPITADDIKGQYHRFRTILRQYNVSRRENAFEVLVNLFLCKIVDEKTAATQPEHGLEFYWKGIAFDNYFDLVDRLQHLYKIGMEQYLKQDIVYIGEKDIDNAFWPFKQKSETEKEVRRMFKQLKFFKGLDFEFIKVSNQDYFERNAKILIEVIEMWQGLRLQTEEQNQFLGDMFENFLDQGVKQSEGQFFTPVPICKFIVNSLPLEGMINGAVPPRALDYACGSGHFLTEYALQIRLLMQQLQQNSDTPHERPQEFYRSIYGIEKEDRLAKVAKVSAFMYGFDEINIIDADALVQHDDMPPESFDILVANPPFAVEGFLKTVPDDDRQKYNLNNIVADSDNKNIQCFFLERAQQVLKAGAVTGIIVPSSILSNSDALHIKTRETLLRSFDFISIAEMGSNTFGKTGTNTVILFLRRKVERPEPADHYENRANIFFNHWEDDTNEDIFVDRALVERYCAYVGYDYVAYQTLLISKISAELLAHEMFQAYQAAFEVLNNIKKLKESKPFKAKTFAQQQADLGILLCNYIRQIEQDKLFYFMLTRHNPVPVLLIKSPSDNKEQKAFLGYEWSGAKGNEGIRYNGGDTVQNIVTPMFNPNNRDDADKLSFYVRQNFCGQLQDVPAHLQGCMTTAKLQDLLDFSRVDFNKAFSLTPKQKATIESQWPLVKLGDVVDVLIGGTPSRSESKYFQGHHLWVSISEMKGNVITNTKEKITDEGVKKSNVKLIKKGTTLLSFKLSIGKTAIAGADLYTNEAIAGLVPKNLKIIQDAYLLHLFAAKMIDLSTGNNAIGQSLNSKFLREELRIPLPPLDVQQKIVDECEVIDFNLNQAKNSFNHLKYELESIVKNENMFNVKKFSDIFDMKAGKFVSSQEISDNLGGENLYHCFGGNGLRGYTKTFTHQGEFLLIGRQGALCGNVCLTPNIKFHATEHAIVLTAKLEIKNKWLYYKLVDLNLNQYSTGVAQPGLSVEILKNVKIDVPPVEIQAQLVAKIETIEQQMAAAQAVIDSAAAQKQAILSKYLNGTTL